MRRTYNIFTTALLALTLIGCSQSKPTPQQESALGSQQTAQILKKVKLSKHPGMNAVVRRVGTKVARVSGRPDFKWQYYVVDNPKTANAFVLPGGKVFVYTGLFKYVQGDSELASVIGHEVAHALKSHGVIGAQRAQNAGLVGGLLQVGMAVAGVDKGVASSVNQAYKYGAALGYLRPHSRGHELEADSDGLMLMAKAGYNPNAAISFWKKFAKASANVPEYLSTHPAAYNRIANLQKLMPQAMSLYKK